MDIPSINEMIETAVAIEAKEGYLAKYLDDLAEARGVDFGDPQRGKALAIFEGYIRSVPTLLSAASESSVGTPVEATMHVVMRAAVAYWDEPEDLVPDALGVLGLLDDAYFTLRMLQEVSQRLHTESGHSLVAEDLSALDAVVRDILGEDLSEILDDLVALSLSNAPVDELIASVAEHAGSFTSPTAQTSFAGRSIDALVGEHLGFTGKPVDPLREKLIAALEQFSVGLTTGELTREAAIAAGTNELGQVFRAAVEAETIAGEPDVALATALLVGGVVHRALSPSAVLDANFVAGAVDLVLEGTAWAPGHAG